MSDGRVWMPSPVDAPLRVLVTEEDIPVITPEQYAEFLKEQKRSTRSSCTGANATVRSGNGFYDFIEFDDVLITGRYKGITVPVPVKGSDLVRQVHPRFRLATPLQAKQLVHANDAVLRTMSWEPVQDLLPMSLILHLEDAEWYVNSHYTPGRKRPVGPPRDRRHYAREFAGRSAA